jgi:hypothetical protein
LPSINTQTGFSGWNRSGFKYVDANYALLTLSTHWRPAQIEIQHASEAIAKLPLEIISNIKETFDCCVDLNEVVLITENEKLWNALKNLRNKGIRVRFVTGVKREIYRLADNC